MFFPQLLPSDCSSTLVGLRKLSSLLPWSYLEIANVTRLSSACSLCVAVSVTSMFPGPLCCSPHAVHSYAPPSWGHSYKLYLHLFVHCKTFLLPFLHEHWFSRWEQFGLPCRRSIKVNWTICYQSQNWCKHSCHSEKLLLSSPGNKWLIREEPEGMCDCWIRKLYGWL